ncbi:hypothetical protein [uncultured Ruegeria sp.]|uniref:hypothetical protein n=1 Tax=uncultured Ruegeria sp. TaxID=259304 RepID=UPI002633F0EC|nr:hypothetical protein [uncultured Ruegeria sp.]
MAERRYLAEALEILDEDSQRALDEDINPRQEILALKEHTYARKKLNLSSSEFEIELISFWIMNQLDEEFGAVLCSSSGGLLRANHPIFYHPDQFFNFHLSFPLRGMSELLGVFKEYDAGRMRGADLWARYCCIDGESGLVMRHNRTKHLFDLYFGDGPSESLENEAFEKYVRPFLGCYVVFDPDVYPDGYYDTYASLLLESKHWRKPELEDEGKAIAKKRGPKNSPAKREFLLRYHKGLPEGLSADAVAAELSASGYPITGRSVLNYDRELRERKISK